MSVITKENQLLKGGEFLIKESQFVDMFIPEDFNEEQQMIRETVRTFVEQDIRPFVDRIEKLEDGLIPSKLDIFETLVY